MRTPTWQKTEMICACGCGRKFKPNYRHGMLISKLAPNCRFKSLIEKEPPKFMSLHSGNAKVSNKPEKRKKTPRQCAMDRADEWFSRYIRLKYSFESGGELFCKCYTCGNPKPILVIENGHFQRRSYKTTRFHPNDARPQCTFCNHHRSGEPEKFELNLIRDIGQDKVNELKKLAQQIGEDNEPFYREQASKYRKLFNMLLKERKLKSPWK